LALGALDYLASPSRPAVCAAELKSGASTSAEVERGIRAARAKNIGIIKIAREVGVGVGTVQRVLTS
jgi:hypothetical protein